MDRQILSIAKCFVFKVPPATVAGHKAKEWPTDPVWSGRLRVQTKNGKCMIMLENADDGKVFAQTEYTQHTVEAVIDSSRYFAVKFTDGQGHTALLGVGFNTRDEAFDFKVALQDYQNGTESAERAEKAVADLGPSIDFSLPEDATIKVNIKVKGGAAATAAKKSSASSSSSGAALFSLAPPPKKADGPVKQKKRSKAVSGKNPSNNNHDDVDDLFGLSDAFAVDASIQPKPAAASKKADEDDPFAAFDANF